MGLLEKYLSVLSTFNFLVFGKENKEESDANEVIRVVKYDKDWTQNTVWITNYDSNSDINVQTLKLIRMAELCGMLPMQAVRFS